MKTLTRVLVLTAALIPCGMFDAPSATAFFDAADAAVEGGNTASPIPEGLRGFRGILVGTLVAKDAEKGTLTVKVTEIKRVWKMSTAKDPNSAIGKEIPVKGVFGKWLDVLVTLQPGEKIELEAFHEADAEQLRFPGEWLKKAEE